MINNTAGKAPIQRASLGQIFSAAQEADAIKNRHITKYGSNRLGIIPNTLRIMSAVGENANIVQIFALFI